MTQRALIIVDVQYDFLQGGSLEVEDGDAIIPVINHLSESRDYDLVVATQDWHPPNHGSFASNHPGSSPFDEGELGGMPQIFWPDHCVQGTSGAEIHKNLDMRPVEAIFRKGMDPDIDSYSGFFDNGHKKDTGLRHYLAGRGIEEVHVCGLAADICVYFTAKDALELGFKTRVIEAATRPIDAQKFEQIKTELAEKGCKFS